MNEQPEPGQSAAGAAGRVLVFARWPVLGRVKSRLAAGIGAEAALAVYRELLAITHDAVAQAGVPSTVWLADEVGPLLNENEAWLQRDARLQALGGDLGYRMAEAFAAAFAEGAKQVVIIGTDCPGLRASHLIGALTHLGEADLVLGPATDGGYYLLGLRAPCAKLFERKAWSTATVLADTLADAQRLGLRVALLPPLRDVDDAADLAAWQAGELQ